jgi:hypothetical protein
MEGRPLPKRMRRVARYRQAATDCVGWPAAYLLWQIKQAGQEITQNRPLTGRSTFQMGPMPPPLTWIKAIVRLPSTMAHCF